MEDTIISIIGIFTASILMFIVPFVAIADRNDEVSQLVVKTQTAEFVDEIIRTGKITDTSYEKYIAGLETSGNTYDIDIEIRILDENSAKRTVTNNGNLSAEPGKNSYYSIFTSQIEQKLTESDKQDDGVYNGSGEIILKEGDEISVTAKNSSKTLSQTLKSMYYTIMGEDLHIIASSNSGTVAVNGSV